MMSRLSVLFLLCATSAGAQIVAAGAPVAEWRLGEGRGTAVEDSSGGGNNGRSHAVEWVGLPVGHALRLDGFRSYVDCGVGEACFDGFTFRFLCFFLGFLGCAMAF